MKQFNLLILSFITTSLFAQNCEAKLEGCGGKRSYYIGTYDTCNFNRNDKIKIPVIVHVVYRNDEQNIPSNLIRKEVDDLKKDFLLLNTDTDKVYSAYKPLIANPNIEFYLADTVLQENGEAGIIREKRSWLQQPYNASPIIQPSKYLNVFSYAPATSKHGGHTSDRCWENSWTDAVFLNYADIGKDYRVLTHETGHWLGLLHNFQCGCDKINDGINDTPPQANAADGDFVIKSDDPKNFDDNCGGGMAMFSNFMDYSLFRKMFTKEQVRIMRILISNKRKEFLPK